MSQRTFWSFAVLLTGTLVASGCAQNRMLGRLPAQDHEIVLAVQESVDASSSIETVSDVTDAEGQSDQATDGWGNGIWNRFRIDANQDVLPRTDFWHPGSTEADASQGFDSGF